MTEDDVGSLVEEAYDAAGFAVRWDAFMESYAKVLGARGGWLISRPPGDAALSIASNVGHDAAYMSAWESHFQHVNPYQGIERFMSPRKAYSIHQFVPKTIAMRSEFYTDFVAPQGYQLGAVVTKFHDGKYGSCGVALHFAADRSDEFIESCVAKQQAMVAPLHGAVLLHMRLAEVEHSSRDLLLALGHARVAVAVCDDRARIHVLSPEAERILEQRDGLSSERGRITGRTERGTSLARELEAAMRPGGPSERGAHVVLRALRPSGRSAYELAVFPTPSRQRWTARRVLVFITDPAAPPAVETSTLEMLYGLTPREARVVQMLAAGHGTDRIARALRVGTETVKTHLRAAFAKTETSRQAELVAKVLSSLAAFARKT